MERRKLKLSDEVVLPPRHDYDFPLSLDAATDYAAAFQLALDAARDLREEIPEGYHHDQTFVAQKTYGVSTYAKAHLFLVEVYAAADEESRSA